MMHLSRSGVGAAGYAVTVDLHRDGVDSAWGFRLKGGIDVDGGTPLEVTKVFVGTASEGLLSPGDRLISINHQDASRLTHLEAQNLMKMSGSSATLEVARPGQRGAYGSAPSGAFFRDTVDGGHGKEFEKAKVHTQPYRTTQLVFPGAKSHVLVDSAKQGLDTNFLGSKKPTGVSSPKAHQLPDSLEGPSERPLWPKDSQKGAFFAPVMMRGQVGQQGYEEMIHRQHNANAAKTVMTALNNKQQPFRTAPLISPLPRTITEVHSSLGSNSRNQPEGQQTPTTGTTGTGGTVVRNVNIGGVKKQVVSNQFNSPMGMYSDEAIAEGVAMGGGGQKLLGTLERPEDPCRPQQLHSSALLHPGYVQSSKPHLPMPKDATFSRPHVSETFKIVLESEMDKIRNEAGLVGTEFPAKQHHHPNLLERPLSSMSNKSNVDPVLLDSSINQSTSFKKVMYSVMEDSDLL